MQSKVLSVILIVLSFIYYLLFVNRGIVIYDEGYYAHIAERILTGEIPFKDFFIQFPPGYFYLLALSYKVLGASILTGRFLTLFICLGIIYITILILNNLNADSKLKILSVFAIVSFGFPLINNMALLAWISVFLSLCVVYAFINKKYLLLAIFLSLLLFTKQNLGIYFLIVTNLFILFLLNSPIKTKLASLIKIDGIPLIFTLTWSLYFFGIQSSIERFTEFFEFNRRYLLIYPFSYPPLSMLFQSTGVFKLFPYYLPIIFAFFIVKEFLNKQSLRSDDLKKKNLSILYFSTISLVGLFGTLYPTSDLLHVYPFFGPFLVSSLLFFKDKNLFRYWRMAVFILIGIGFYLTLFREYYRYQVPYRFQKTSLDLPKTQGIRVDEPLATDLALLNLFITINTKKEDYILSYPFAPMLYFILDRQNPSRFATYYPGYLTNEQEEEVLRDIKNKRVRFILTFLEYKFEKPISKFIQKQNLILERGQFKVFEVK